MTYYSHNGRRVRMFDDRIVRGKDEQPLTGVHAEVVRGSDLESRVTATRLLTMGVFALAAKKKHGGEAFLMIAGPEFDWAVPVAHDEVKSAYAFAVAVNAKVKAATAQAVEQERPTTDR